MKVNNIIYGKNYLFGYLLFTLMIFIGCDKIDNYLDKAETGGTSEEDIFSDYLQTQYYLANIYNTGIGSGDWMPKATFTYSAATDEAFCPYPRPNSPLSFNNGSLSPTNNPVDVWNAQYANIRKVNRFLSYIDNVPTSNADQYNGKMRMKGEGYFLRAWFYQELLKRYGGVPIITKVLKIEDDLNIPKNTAEEVVDLINRDCDSAAILLPEVHAISELGRATKGAALALKARVLLYSASPLHNTTNNLEKWKAAADAAKAVMDMNIYSLDNNYKTLFHTRNSPELIFQSNINHVWNVTTEDWVRHTQPPSQGGGWGNLQPTQNLVDDYEMVDGTSFNWSNPTHATNPYLNRDPRFHMSIIYNGRKWATSTINTFVGSGVDGFNYNNNPQATKTGYYVAKLLDENSTLLVSYRPGSHYWVFMRYAEVLLNYAEAQNEALSSPDQSVYRAINDIRSRPGVNMPPLPNDLSKEQMRDRIRHERRIELAFETHRFWDVRRWRLGTQVFTDAIGLRITRSGNNNTYEKVVAEKRRYKPAYDLYPIPQDEVEKNKSLIQNQGY